jgi:DNA-binding response OmpR family regulator
MRRESTRMHAIVVIVEDELLLRCWLADEFRKAGYQVLEAATADHAIAICRDETPIHILITDIELNGSGSGWEVARAFRALRENVSIVYTSGNALDAEQSVPGSLFFPKPYHATEIVTTCQQLVASRNR